MPCSPSWASWCCRPSSSRWPPSTAAPSSSFPPETWSLRWFVKALAYEDFRAGFRNGLIVTAWASTIALVVGAAFAFALDRYQFRLKRGIETVLLSPLVMPHFTVGLGFLIIAAQLGLARGFATVIAAHVVLVLALRAAQRLRLAAQSRSDGSSWRPPASARRPPACSPPSPCRCCCPAWSSGWLFAAILSFNEFTASLFVTAQRTQTLPVAMYNYVREYADPSMAALSVMYIVATATLLTFANAFLGLGKVLNVEHAR